MNKILRAAVVGFAIGTALFFVPFLFRFILFAILIGFILRMVSGRRRHYHMARWQRFHGYSHYRPYDNEAIPIDGKWYRPDMQKGGASNDIPIS